MISSKKIQAFTLVELIIVITILAILATIAFVSFQNYTKEARDSNRLTSLKNIENGLQAFQIKVGSYPDSENALTILASGSIIGYQGYFGDNQSKLTNMKITPLDPLDQTKYIYSINQNKTKFQLLGLLESNNPIAYMSKTFAIDYSKRIPKTFGNNLGIFLNTDNSSISGTGIDIVKTNNNYKAILNNSSKGIISGTGEQLRVSSIGFNNTLSYSKSCKEIFDTGMNTGNGIYKINPSLTATFDAYCDMSTEGGGWTRLNNNLVNELSGTGLTLGIIFGTDDKISGFNNWRGCSANGLYNFKISGLKLSNYSQLRFELERIETILQCSQLSPDYNASSHIGSTTKVGYLDTSKNFFTWGSTCQWYNQDNNSKWDTGHGEKLTNSANKYWRWVYNYTGTSDIYYTTGCSGPNDNGSFISQIYIK